MTNIVAFSGKKSSGKNTACNFVVGLELMSLGIADNFVVRPDGQLLVHEPGAEEKAYKLYNPLDMSEEMMLFNMENVWPFVKVYSFADLLKWNVCIQVLGLSVDQCFGTEDQKNSETHLLWDNLSTEIRIKYSQSKSKKPHLKAERSGPMTAREVMQVWGTDIFRVAYPNVWVDGLIRRIQAEQPQLALICDCRFENEVDGVINAGGKVIRLLRNPNGDSDQHPSETALDSYTFEHIVDNSNLSIEESNEKVFNLIKSFGYFEYEQQTEVIDASKHVEIVQAN